MRKMDGRSFDQVQNNTQKIKMLFPEVVTEGKVDFQKLRLLLGDQVEQEKERYEFTWNGKSEAIQLAQKQTTGTLRPVKEDSVNWEHTENLYIEGDNLEVLRVLQNAYRNKVKMIYIDPPYNTGRDFIYNDNYRDNITNYIEKNQENMKTNPETNGRFHTDWLNMMYPRLKIAKNLLKEDGVIFISIDENEESNLSKVCDEIFGEDNLVAKIPWQARQSIQNDTDLSISHEYILAYAKKRRKEHRRLKESNADLWFSMDSFACFPLPLSEDKFSNPDNDPRGPWKTDPFDAPNVRPNLTYDIENPNTGEKFWPPAGRCWRTDKTKYQELLRDNRIVFGKTGESRPQLKVFYEEKKAFGSVANTWFTGDMYGTATRGTKEVQKLFDGVSYFDTVKPTDLLKHLMQLSVKSDENEIILDFFSGSGTTADAVMQLNAEDQGNRKFMMVQLPEEIEGKSAAYKAGYRTISDIGKERIRRAGQSILEKTESQTNIDVGFKVFQLDSTNLKMWDTEAADVEQNLLDQLDPIKETRTQRDVCYEILLKYGIALTVPIEIDQMDEKVVYVIGAGDLIICLERDLSLSFIEQIVTKYKDCKRIVFYDEGFRDDTIRTNAQQLLKRYGVEDIRVI
ncbi:site-specific DNA-methyltransferase [Oceanobacillus halotolerans]|uniref:site-specific DNA-methyltransferase n=1 Tax=Oceanobacillus halotolerans TaxID=2663380 RepID=UPI0013D9A6CA|nr:site-specific DNA-methyltransferase [Oceanobacillus halotolerans]